ncbi:sensor histidine kinase [Hoeflea marina]|nr:ATP-binding protein [Hoeflea marina]
MHRRDGRLTLLMLAAAGIASLAAWYVAHGAAISALQAGLEQNLIVTKRAIESEVERFRYLPRVLGEDARIRQLIARPGDGDAVEAANAYLRTVAGQSGAAQLYVLNDAGLTLAASNHDEPGSFVGNSYSFRPYYRDAMAGGEGRYYAIGVTTGRPGYFLSSRLLTRDGIIGVVVAKVDLEPLETAWQAAGAQTAIADRNGVVFLSGNPDWKYRPLSPLTAQAQARIAEERTYEGIELASARPLLEGGSAAAPAGAGGTEFAPGAGGSGLLARFRPVDPDGWLILSATDTAAARDRAGFWALVAGLSGLLAAGGVHYLGQRRVLTQLRLRQTDMLERMVGERTRELARENEIRRRTEADLRAAQEGLIHSEKMAALGRMSAAIVHEVAQPLAALETTLATADALARQIDAGPVGERLKAARALIRRMQRTVKHLKSFGRRDAAELTLVDIDEAVRNALEVVSARARSVGVTPHFAPEGSPPFVPAVAVKLEQVLINLIVNALDAVEGAAQGAVTVERESAGARLTVRVSDNGPGISRELMPRISEPFFTTKISGGGLGLGLSISNAIMAEFGGDIVFSSAPGGGTVATVSMPVAPPQRVAAE